jgi:hypothetical protein
MPEVLSIEVTFSLPDWIEEFDYDKIHVYQSGSWKGQYEKTTIENKVSDVLWEKMHWEEICLHPMGKWIKFILQETDMFNSIGKEILQLQQEVDAILAKFEKKRKKSNGRQKTR